ncbi:outer membrane protein transport protein, partial [Klebsiella pneumoniae]
WGRAFGGGSLFKNDPSSAFNNPAAMAFVDKTISQFTVDYARISIKMKGQSKDYNGDPLTRTPIAPDGSILFDDASVVNGEGGQGGFT